jgi:hypothetical protein
MVAECRNADTGVGASIAFGSQMCNGTCADFAAAPTPTSTNTGTNSPASCRAARTASGCESSACSPPMSRNVDPAMAVTSVETARKSRNPTSKKRPPPTVMTIDFRAAYCESGSSR